MISAALVGISGSLKTVILGFATLTDVPRAGHPDDAGGRPGHLVWPIAGSAVIVALKNKIGEAGIVLAQISDVEWFDTLGESVSIVTGLIFVRCVLAFRRGVMGEVIAWVDRRK